MDQNSQNLLYYTLFQPSNWICVRTKNRWSLLEATASSEMHSIDRFLSVILKCHKQSAKHSHIYPCIRLSSSQGNTVLNLLHISLFPTTPTKVS